MSFHLPFTPSCAVKKPFAETTSAPGAQNRTNTKNLSSIRIDVIAWKKLKMSFSPLLLEIIIAYLNGCQMSSKIHLKPAFLRRCEVFPLRPAQQASRPKQSQFLAILGCFPQSYKNAVFL